jgi:RNA polymerase-interacting CarD/CdnL/TRCF family regulator
MTDTKNIFAVNDYIIDFENIYQIFEQKNQKNYSGQNAEYFFYRSIETNSRNQQVVCSTPIENIAKSGLRHLIDLKDVKDFYKQLEEKYDEVNFIDPKLIKEILYLNNPLKNLDILKQLFSEKNQKPDTFSRSNKELTENLLNHVSNEIAFVAQKPVVTVKAKIVSVLSKI